MNSNKLMHKILAAFLLIFAPYLLTAQVKPAAPSNVTISQINITNTAEVTWKKPSGTYHGFELEYKKKGASSGNIIKLDKSLSDYILTGLSYDTEYEVRMRTYRVDTGEDDEDETIYSNYSNIASVLIKNLEAPNLTLVSSDHNSITIQITDNNQFETGFKIEIESDGFTKTETYNSSGTILTYLIKDLKPNTLYYIRVRATIGDQASPWSDKKNIKTKIDLPGEAVLTEISNCPNKVQFKWVIKDRLDEIATFIVERSTNNSNYQTLAELSTDQFEYEDETAEAGTTYYYRIVSKNSSGRLPSKELVVNVVHYSPSNGPGNLRSVNESKTVSSLTFIWNNLPNENECNINQLASYEISARINGGNRQVLEKDWPAWNTEYTVDGLQMKDAVEISLRPISHENIYGGYFSAIDTTYGIPNKPSNFIGVVNPNRHGKQTLTLEWKNNANDVDYFEIHKSKNGGNYHQFAVVLGHYPWKKIEDSDIEEGDYYSYMIRAVNWVNNNPDTWITTGPFTIRFTSKPTNPPFGLALLTDGKSVEMQWVDDSINEEYFIIEKSIDNTDNFHEITNIPKDGTYYKDHNILNGRTYFYRVKAINPLGSSPYSQIKKITIPAVDGPPGFNFTVYPNPFIETIRLKAEGNISAEMFTLKIYDSNNMLVTEKEFKVTDKDALSIPMENFRPGVYNLNITQGKSMISKKIIKL